MTADETLAALVAERTRELEQELAERKRKEAEAALRESEQRHRAILRTAMDGFWLVDPQGRLLEVNETYCRMSGYSEAELLAMSIRDLEADETANHMATRFQEIMARGEERFESRHRRKDGSVFAVEVSVQYRPTEGGRIVAFLRDITDRRRAAKAKAELEAQNRQLQKSESLGRMAGAIAHHFNNQLQAVMLNLEMAMNDLPRNARPIDHLTAALESARKAAEVSGLMLTYLGKTDAKREPLDLSEACQRHLPMLRASLPRAVDLEIDLPSPGPAVRANGNQIQQVLTNLVTNAWEASGDGRGAIRLTVRSVAAADIPAANRFPIDWQPRDHAYACLEVADAGCGITGKDFEKLFDPFFSRKFSGRGLGLPVVLGIVRAHQGTITVTSEPGRGSVFRVFLPISAEAVPHKPVPAAQVPEPDGGGTVLLVEDEPVVRQTVALALAGMGFTVLDARDGVEAVEIFRRRRDEIRLVLCDLTMPRMDGWETLTALRQLSPDLPVILSSGYSEAQVMEGHHSELPQAFLRKPCGFNTLRDAIARATAPKRS